MPFDVILPLMFRTDFSDDSAWQKVLGALRAQGLDETKLGIIEDRGRFENARVEQFAQAGLIGWGRPMLFMADAETMKGDGSLLCADIIRGQRRVAQAGLADMLNAPADGIDPIWHAVGKLFEGNTEGVRFPSDWPLAAGGAAADVDDKRSPLVRIDFSDDSAWHAVLETIRASSFQDFTADLALVEDRRFEGIEPRGLPMEDLGHDVWASYVYVADPRTMTDPEHSILCVDLEEGGEFRCTAKALHGLVVNLSIGNVDFFELADEVEADGVYRGSQPSMARR